MGSHEELTSKDKGQELLHKLDGLFNEAKKTQKKIHRVCNDNKDFYLGKQWGKHKRPTYKADITLNLVFMAIETISPIMTDSQPIMIVDKADDMGDRAEEANDMANRCENMLKAHWERLKMRLMTPQIVRHQQIYRDAILHPCWNYYEDDVDVKLINPRHFYLDPNATSLDEAEYCFIARARSLKYIKETYPEAREKIEEIKRAVPEKDEVDDEMESKERQSKVLVKEFWGWVDNGESYDLKVITYAGNVMLRNEVNPYFDQEGVVTEEGKLKYYNHIKKPQLPFILIPSYQLGEKAFSETSALEQTKKIQEAVNKRKCQISDNADMMTNGMWFISKDTGININDLINKPGLVTRANIVDQGHIRKVTGSPLPGFIQQDLEHSQSVFDNIFGTHDISRGGKVKTPSATESQILKEADQGRIALLIRNLEAGIEQLGNWWLHLMKMYYTETHYGRYLNQEDMIEHVKIIRDDIPDDIEVKVRTGSAIPVDRGAKRAEAMEMLGGSTLDPITAYKRMGDIEKPEDTAERLKLWRNGMLPGDEEEMMAQQQGMPPQGQPPQEELPPDLEGNPELQAEQQEELPPEI